MKHLKLFESFREEDIHAICDKYCIRNYIINEDESIDVDGDVDLNWKKLNKLPLKFRNVTGSFSCRYNLLTSLEGCPKSVDGDFDCDQNKLTSLEGCPKSVDGDFDCSDNKIVTFEHLPFSIGGEFNCEFNNIFTFEHLPFSIGGNFFLCGNNPIWQIWKLFQDYDKIEFLNDCDAIREPDDNSKKPIIILDRFNFFLEEIGKKPVTKVKGYKCI